MDIEDRVLRETPIMHIDPRNHQAVSNANSNVMTYGWNVASGLSADPKSFYYHSDSAPQPAPHVQMAHGCSSDVHAQYACGMTTDLTGAMLGAI